MIQVALIAPGAMGSALGRRLVEHGARVMTTLDGAAARVRRGRATPAWKQSRARR